MPKKVTQIIQLSEPGEILRFRLHPGVKAFFKDRSKDNSRILQNILIEYFFEHASDEEIQRYLGPHETIHRPISSEVSSGQQRSSK